VNAFPFRTAVALAIGFGVAACDNMKDQANLRPMVASRQFPDGASSRPLPAHTVARGQPAVNDPLITGFRDGVELAHSPVAFTPELLARGRERFNIYCAVCHGEDGYGTGIVVRRGFPAPPSLHDERLRQTPDGHVFDVMTRGFGVMLPYVDRIEPRDRWAIVGYVRALQRSQHATLVDVPESQRRQLTAP